MEDKLKELKGDYEKYIRPIQTLYKEFEGCGSIEEKLTFVQETITDCDMMMLDNKKEDKSIGNALTYSEAGDAKFEESNYLEALQLYVSNFIVLFVQ